MNTLSETETLIRASFEAFRGGDRAAQERFLAESFTFTSPYDDAIGRDAYFERCWPNHARVADFEIERCAVDADGAFVTYLFTDKDGLAFRNTEYLKVQDRKIVSADVYFGASYKGAQFVAKKPE
jgi:ketosteroid isomerase-like protein